MITLPSTGSGREVLVIVAASAFLGVLAYALHAASSTGWRLAFLRASILSGVLVWAFSETLGAFRLLSLPGLLACWLAAGMAAVIAARQKGHGLGRTPHDEFSRFLTLPAGVIWTLAFLVIVVGVLATVAFFAAPNTWDSMTYHLSRVMHWQQNRSMDFYATSIQRQLAFGPWAEMAMLHLQVVAGSDRLANFVQLFALVGCAAGASLLAQRLGGSVQVQAASALACVTLPMGILQATSTQNDLVTAFWCTAFAALVLNTSTPRRQPLETIEIGLAAGLAVLTKITAALYLMPFGVWYGITLLRREHRNSWRPLVISAGAAALILAPHSLRNLRLYGNPLGIAPGPELSGYTNDLVGLQTLVSNVLRNSALQLAAPIEAVNTTSRDLILGIHRFLRLDASDPRTTWTGARFEVIFSMYEDNAGNPLHFLLFCFGLALILRSRDTDISTFGICTLSGFLLFCLLLRWQPWNSRLMLPFLILAMPLTAIMLSRQLPGGRILLLGIVLAVCALPYLVANPTRSLIGENSIFVKPRLLQYFANVPDQPEVYLEAADLIRERGCDDVGLASPPEGREYLFWAALAANGPPVRIEHVLVKNRSRRYAADRMPCAVAITYPYLQEQLVIGGTTFERRTGSERFNVFFPAGGQP